MWKTALFLLLTIIVIPFFALRFNEPLTPLQVEVLRDLLTIYILAAGACFLLVKHFLS